ncbi:MAG: hypothetical protein ILO36_04505 [Abditibacteriota bacterium]|nr:hypothetical protein [Abditibacteriota bacterium]
MKPDKPALITYSIVFIVFLTLIKMNPAVIGLAGALPAFMGAALSFLRKPWVRSALMLYGAGIFLLQAIAVANFFFGFYEADNAFVLLLLAPLPVASLVMAVCAAIGKRAKK